MSWKWHEVLGLLMLWALIAGSAVWQRHQDIKNCPPDGRYARNEAGHRYCTHFVRQ